jgi:hypothetical protein
MEITRVKSNLRTPYFLLKNELWKEYGEVFKVMDAVAKADCSDTLLPDIVNYYQNVVAPCITHAEEESPETAAKIKDLRREHGINIQLYSVCLKEYDFQTFQSIESTIDGIIKTILRPGGQRKTARKKGVRRR